MVNLLPNSPFGQTQFEALGEFQRKGSHTGLLLPDGQVLINFNENTSHSVLVGIAKALHADLITVTGTWSFVPDEIAVTQFKKIKMSE